MEGNLNNNSKRELLIIKKRKAREKKFNSLLKFLLVELI